MCNRDGDCNRRRDARDAQHPGNEKLSIRVLLRPVILLDDRFVVGMVEQKARRLVIILGSYNDRDAALALGVPSKVHVSNPDFAVRGPAIYLPNTASHLSLQ